jgi:hypothetical protein
MIKQSIFKQRAINFFSFPVSYLLFLVLALQFACTQPPCTLTAEQAPELRGFRLLMSIEEIQAKHRGFPTPPADEFGLAKVVIVDNLNGKTKDDIKPYGATVVNSADFPEIKGISRIYLEIIDNRLASIQVVYLNDVKWNSVDEFIKKTAQTMKLNGSWEKVNGDYQSLRCGEVSVRAGIRRDGYQFGNYEKLPFVELVTYKQYKEYELRKLNNGEAANRKEQERRDVFKP